ncbi:hypothetical protein RHMOL_Rhmol08G0252500 [Rhododendron molle]|uniref:Uncharacterized protein n=1 Tax=Rhododendron molle TaxID=49168 RepID=A0ACC0MSK2_RHOML|nr:hypothetical protein RHMOL_Rhmol08G0252500 [Rhododendron molle]
MAGSVENSVTKPHTDEHHQPLQELGLGFRSSPDDNDLDRQTSNEEHRNQQLLETLSEEIRVLVLEEKERENESDDNVDRRIENGLGFCMGNEGVGEEAAVAPVVKDGRQRIYHYPVRPGAEDCAHYMRTGTCKFGKNCKFNHQRRRKYQAWGVYVVVTLLLFHLVVYWLVIICLVYGLLLPTLLKPAKESLSEKEENSERPGLVQCKPAEENMKEKEENTESPVLVQCKYYLSSGGCIFGKACKYNHGRGKVPVAPIIEFNFLGLPIRPGEKDCPYYMRNGSCKYESNCWFNHPDPTTLGGVNNLSVCGNAGSVPSQGAFQSRSQPRTTNETVPFVPVVFSPSHNVPPPNVGCNGYQAPAHPGPERRLAVPPAFAVNNSAEMNVYTHHNFPMLDNEFPERPGQPECTYFLKTGDCKYRSACKFHHPKYRIQKTATFAMSDKGLPLRPEENVCSHYYHYGICKFGPGCKYDHPVKYSRSASSTASGPGMPYRFGNSATTNMAGNSA